MIVIKDTKTVRNDEVILEALGVADFQPSEDMNLEEVFQPKDDSVNIACFEDYTIICDDFRYTDLFFSDILCDEEEALVSMFPHATILSICSMGNLNFKGYAVIQNGEKSRYKTSDEMDFYEAEKGNITKNELSIFENSDFDFVSKMLKEIMGLDLEDEASSPLFSDYLFKKYRPNPIVEEQDDEEDYDDDEDSEEGEEEVKANAQSDSEKTWWQFWK